MKTMTLEDLRINANNGFLQYLNPYYLVLCVYNSHARFGEQWEMDWTYEVFFLLHFFVINGSRIVLS